MASLQPHEQHVNPAIGATVQQAFQLEVDSKKKPNDMGQKF